MIGVNGFVLTSLVFWLVALALAALWICLPFAVFGLKALVRQAIGEAEKANALLERISEQNRVLAEQQKAPAARSGEENHT